MSPALLLAEPEAPARAHLEHHLAEDGFAVLGAEDETRALWRRERVFHPGMSAADRDRLYAGWQRAVARITN